MRPPGSREQLDRWRLQAIALLKEGVLPVDVATRLGVDRRSVGRWRASHDPECRKGLASRPAPGRPPKLDANRIADLEETLIRGAKKCGFPTDLWRCPRVAEVIRRKFGLHYHVDHIGRLLRCKALVKIMKRVTGEKPVLWGPSIVGFGRYHYKYASGHEGDAWATDT